MKAIEEREREREIEREREGDQCFYNKLKKIGIQAVDSLLNGEPFSKPRLLS